MKLDTLLKEFDDAHALAQNGKPVAHRISYLKHMVKTYMKMQGTQDHLEYENKFRRPVDGAVIKILDWDQKTNLIRFETIKGQVNGPFLNVAVLTTFWEIA